MDFLLGGGGIVNLVLKLLKLLLNTINGLLKVKTPEKRTTQNQLKVEAPLIWPA